MWLGVIVGGRCYCFSAKLIIVAKHKEKINDQKRKTGAAKRAGSF
jgi:hypothetical protein